MLNTCAHRICRTTEPCRYGDPSAPERDAYGTDTPGRETVAVARAGAVVHYLEGRSRSGVPVTECGIGLTGGVVVEPGVAGCRACIEVDERKLEQQLADEAVERAEVFLEAGIDAEVAAQIDADPRITRNPAELRVLLAAAARLDALPTDDGLLDEFDADDEPAHTLIVTQCSAAKLEQPAPARDLYRGTLSTMGVAAAERIAHSHLNVSHGILSALHGLLEPSTVVEPYDVTWGDSRAISATEVAGQLVAAGVQRVVALTSNRYAEVLEVACEIAGVELVHALAGCRGIFEQRGRLSRYRRSAGISSPYADADLPDLGLVHAGPLVSR